MRLKALMREADRLLSLAPKALQAELDEDPDVDAMLGRLNNGESLRGYRQTALRVIQRVHRALDACRVCSGTGRRTYRRRASGGAFAEYTGPCPCVKRKPIKDRYGNVVCAVCTKCKQDWQKHEMVGGVCPPCRWTFKQYKAQAERDGLAVK